MIYLGLNNQAKDMHINAYCAAHDIEKVFILSPEKFKFTSSFANTEYIEWADIIMYKFYYRLLQEIGQRSLVVVNECLRTQNRYDLTYNCIRHFLNQTNHQLIFQYLPLIDEQEDFMVLFDFDTRSRWKREKYRADLLAESSIEISPVHLTFNRVEIETPDKLRKDYQKEKQRLIENIGLKDPHTIPRNLYLLSGKAKLQYIEMNKGGLFGNHDSYYIGRNNRFKLSNIQTYKEHSYPHVPYTVFEFCHNFIDFSDFAALSQQLEFNVLCADLKVDQWYFQRYQQWTERLMDAYASIQQKQECAGSRT
jgi:hypothetical protein